MPSSTVYGVVLKAGTSDLITNATVTSNSPSLPINSGGGTYSGTGPDGSYTLTASAPGYQNNSINIQLSGGLFNQNIDLSPV